MVGERLRGLFSGVQNASARAGEGRELPIPEGLINAAIDRLVVKGDLEALAVRLDADVLRIDVELRTSWAQLAMTGHFALAGIVIDKRRQHIDLHQLGALDVRTSRYASDWHRILLLALSPLLGWLAGMAFRHALNKLDGVRAAGRDYHFDLSPHIRKDSWLMTTISALNVTGARFEPGQLILRGNLNVLGAFG